MKLKCLEKGFFFDNIVIQFNWRNPEVWDRMGKFMAVFDDTLEFRELSPEEGFKLLFSFKRYPEIIGSIQLSRLWFQMKILDSNYTLNLFCDQAFKVITTAFEEIRPLRVNSLGIRIATILDKEKHNGLPKSFLNLMPFDFKAKVGELHNARLAWFYKDSNYKKYFELSQHIQVFYGEKPSGLKREDLPNEGMILDVDSIVGFKDEDQNPRMNLLKSKIIVDIASKYDKIADELLGRLG